MAKKSKTNYRKAVFRKKWRQIIEKKIEFFDFFSQITFLADSDREFFV
jgi:hypothetical protein